MLVIYSLNLLAVMLFAISQSKHYQAVFHQRPSNAKQNSLFYSGVIMLFLSLYTLIQRPTANIDSVYWLTSFSFFIVLVAGALSYFSKQQKR
jgi:hypothetical protein